MTTPEHIRVAVIGCGLIGSEWDRNTPADALALTHARAFSQLQQGHLLVVGHLYDQELIYTPLMRENVRAIRPGLGLPTKYLEVVLGKPVNRDVKRGSALAWNLH